MSPSGAAQANMQYKSGCLSANAHMETHITLSQSPQIPTPAQVLGTSHTRGLASIQWGREVQSVHWLISFPFWLCSRNDVMLLAFRPPPTQCLPTPGFLSLPPLLLSPFPSLSLPGSSNFTALAARAVKSLRALGRHSSEKLFERNQNTPGPSSRRSGDGGAVAMGTRVNIGRNKGLKQLAAAWLSE